jgi:hypothetical protein
MKSLGDGNMAKELAHSLTFSRSGVKKQYISLSKINEIADSSVLVQSALATILETVNQYTQCPITAYLSVKIEQISLEWVLGMTLEAHDDNFVTLDTRNLTKLLLNELDKNFRQQEVG